MQLNGREIEFRQPFLLYDTISIYDKSKGRYVPKKRSTAVSYSDTEEILLAMTVCSDNDTFMKSTARKILQGRVDAALEAYLNEREPTFLHSFTDGTYLFTDYESFVQFCNTIDAMGRQFFAPYRMEYANKITNDPGTIKLSGFSDLYLHRAFIRDTWTQYAEDIRSGKISLDTTTSANGKTEKRDSHSPVSAR